MTTPFFYTWSAQSKVAPLQLEGGDGSWFIADGDRWLDLGSLVYQANLGHGHPRVISAVQAQAARLCVSMPNAVYPEKVQLAERLLERAPPGFTKVFFTLGGSDAIENALKLARLVTGRHKAISRYRSYHGATMGAAALTGDWRRTAVEPVLAGVTHVLDLDVPPPRGSTSFIPRTLELEGGVAAVFLEAVVGGNGVLIPPDGYFAEIREACDAHGALLVCDEVLTGFGRTGRWFAYEHFDAKPDLITVGKALTGGYGTLGAVLVHERVAAAFETNVLPMGLTHYAHPLGVAAALATIEVMENEDLVARAAALGPKLQEGLVALAERHAMAGAVRSIGLLGALDLDLDAAAFERLSAALRERRVHLHVQKRVGALIFSPPLCISSEELDGGLSRVDDALGSLT
jgi:taurine--2-oxoglutarate transaminase